jgi:hypothetical protein
MILPRGTRKVEFTSVKSDNGVFCVHLIGVPAEIFLRSNRMTVNEGNTATRGGRWAALSFAAVTLLGAFLLFQVQPLIGKFILPWFGGAPAVWTTCILFFQLALFGGYAYSHLVVLWLTSRAQAITQCALLLAALALLPVVPAEFWKPSDDEAPTLRILLLLAATVGLPYFVLTTTSPLVQAWFNRVYPGRAPYRLYALSNIGSLAALLSYPFVVEPMFDLRTQAHLWSWSFVAYCLLMIVCAVLVGLLNSPLTREPPSPPAPLPAGEGTNVPTWRLRTLWLLLPACASVILLATTNHVCQDVAPRPFLWVMPLSLYLLSFVFCFDHPRWYVRPLWAVPAVIGIAIVLGSDASLRGLRDPYQQAGISLAFSYILLLHFGTMFCICMVCHGELARLKPEPRHLTEFYLWLAGGGALGGVLVGLVAPHVFDTFREWNLGMIAAYLIATAALFLAVPKRGRGRVPALTAAGLAAGGFLAVLFSQFYTSAPDRNDPQLIDRRRNFYGVVSVWAVDRNDPAKDCLRMQHGAIVHGQQFVSPEKRGKMYNYYTPDSGISLAIRALQERRPSLKVGVVGLGIGTLAGFARPGDRFAFYEINPAVRDMAEKYFFYIRDARNRGAKIDIVPGDARLSLERQPPQNFDLLVLDAFSGDSVPPHLLTREALVIYQRHVASDGVIAIHATNSYLYLFPLARALADAAGLDWRRVYLPTDESKQRLRSNWVIASRDRSLLDDIPNVPPPQEFKDDFTVPVWSDQKNDLFRILIK